MSRLELAARGLPDSALAGLVGLAELATRRWRGRAIFGPHITPSALHDASAHTETRHPSLQQEN